ncbi:MAG: DNA translocase FtsK, partial [Agathobacter sp.]|nr:DNA translocase FtsK [Agathobacter sp.]
MATKRRTTSSGRKTKKQRMQEMERAEAFRLEIILWIIIAISLLLFISNFGVGGKVGDVVSRFSFGIFGLFAYIFPIALVVGSFFTVSNKQNRIAIIKLVFS